MKIFSPILLFPFLIIACSGKNRIPKGVLSKEKMQVVLWDILRADEFVAGFVLPKDSTLDKKRESTLLYEQVFRIHQSSREEFKKSILFYQSHPSLFKIILDSLQARQSALAAEQNKPVRVDTGLIRKVKEINPQ
jgi:hypothetical protein